MNAKADDSKRSRKKVSVRKTAPSDEQTQETLQAGSYQGDEAVELETSDFQGYEQGGATVTYQQAPQFPPLTLPVLHRMLWAHL